MIKINKIRRVKEDDDALEKYKGKWAVAAFVTQLGLVVADVHYDRYEDAVSDKIIAEKLIEKHNSVHLCPVNQVVFTRSIKFLTVVPVL